MSQRLVTIASCSTPGETHVARNRLEAAGLKAFVGDEEIVGMYWLLSNAVGGVKLLVEEQDANAARAVLAGSSQDEPADSEAAGAMASDPEEDEGELALTRREENARHALRGAIIGLFVLPLQLLVFWLLLEVFVSDERLGAGQRRSALIATAINLPIMIVFCLLVRGLFP
jgi:hypothetical protein